MNAHVALHLLSVYINKQAISTLSAGLSVGGKAWRNQIKKLEDAIQLYYDMANTASHKQNVKQRQSNISYPTQCAVYER